MITCSVCGFQDNPDESEFCSACGAELTSMDTISPEVSIPEVEPPPSIPSPPTAIPNGSAKLTPKQLGCPVSEFLLDGSYMIIGRFDPDTGPVDIDLEGFPGQDTISRNHAEIYQESGVWKVKDLGSVNGIFIRRVGENRFSSRITTPEILHSGDELAIAKIRFLFEVL